MIELSTRYTPKETEDKWRRYWEEQNLFHAEPNPDKKPFTIVIPPPNITGILHMGHALNNTLQDIMIRYKRMKGFETLWMPGTDHAGIATQNVVEKQLAREGKKRQDLGREEFTGRLWEWKKQYGDTIIHQLKKLGSSCDWQRTRFTMDEHYSEVVKYVFVELYKKGLIYRGKYIINWCPRCQTALSDEEAQHAETQGKLYYIRYPFKNNPNEFVLVATTRPETMLGDTAVAVNPKDKRYKKLIGTTLVLPLVNREIKIIADEFVDVKFGTGAVKVTPAHDPNDFEMGKRHNLDFINILHPDARLNEQAGAFSGLDRFKARQAVIEALQEKSFLEKIEEHTHAVGHCYRCHTVVEPYLSKQWFVKMKPLAKSAIDVVKKGKIKFYPQRWTKVYLNWMENIRDWCISRQIWWGHRLPVYYCKDCQANKSQVTSHKSQKNSKSPTPNVEQEQGIIVSCVKPEKCPTCGSADLIQDEDVLDTWFSSWLWPFATFHWPEKREDVNYFYPTSSLFTAPEIIFFWVARMIMAGLEFLKDIPFSDVYIHGTVRDSKGLKMSKSLGNAIDPLEIINEYGADALRFSLIVNSGQDLFISKEKFEIGRNFANKIWNASRLILMNIDETTIKSDVQKMTEKEDLDLPSQWILSRFQSTLQKVSEAIEKYRFSEAETLVYDFFWKDFCDWYLEIIKDRFSDTQTQSVSLHILEQSLRLLHPFMPFVTEEIWQKINTHSQASLVSQEWPVFNRKLVNKKAEKQMQMIINLVAAVRNVRAHWNIDQNAKIDCVVIPNTKQAAALFYETAALPANLAKIKTLNISQQPLPKPKNAATGLTEDAKFYIPLNEIIDVEKEKNRILAQIAGQKNSQQSLANRLKNKDFLKKAPQEVVSKEHNRLKELNTQIAELQKTIAELS